MSGKTKISWTDATWNPGRGCSMVSPGCTHCYAMHQAARINRQSHGRDPNATPPYDGLVKLGAGGKGALWTGKVRMVKEHLHDPLAWSRPRRVFVNSMTDLFHDGYDPFEIAAVFGVMAAAPRHTFQILTKRHREQRGWFQWVIEETARHGCSILAFVLNAAARLLERFGQSAWSFKLDDLSQRAWHESTSPWPLPNVWMGVTAEDQEHALERIPYLLETPAALRFVSLEPLLGPIDLTKIGRWRDVEMSALAEQVGHVNRPRLDWVIAGCESGGGARPCKPAWLRHLREQCAAAQVPYFLKQAVYTPGVFVERDALGRKCSATLEVGADTGSRTKNGGVIELPYLDGLQSAEFPFTVAVT